MFSQVRIYKKSIPKLQELVKLYETTFNQRFNQSDVLDELLDKALERIEK